MTTNSVSGKNVALVLSGGGARGFAHIGAIEELETRGYHITSVAGTSIGSMVGGLFATGHLPEVKQWLLKLDWGKIISLLDVSLSTSHVVKGERIINALNELVPDRRIENLPIPFCAIATDLRTNSEVVFDRGSLYAAMRASIAIPSVFSPLRTKRFLLVDGGMVNPLPLNRVVRRSAGDDILVAVNMSGREGGTHVPGGKASAGAAVSVLPALSAERSRFWDKMKVLLSVNALAENNYYYIMHRSSMMMIEQLAALSLRITPPDVLAEIPMNRFGVFEFDNAEEIIEAGRAEMRRALDAYESGAGE